MINYYSSLTIEEKILLSEIITRNKKCEMEISLDVLPCVRQEVAVEYVVEAIKTQLKPEGEAMAVTILQKILGKYVESEPVIENKNLIEIKKPRKKRASKKIDYLV